MKNFKRNARLFICKLQCFRLAQVSKGITVGTFKKASLVKLRLDGNIGFQEDVLDLRERLGINDVEMPDLMVPCWTMKVTEGWGE